jgi:serine/threonine protein phosphatase PrpC
MSGTLINSSVGSYRLIDFLGAGGMGEVYRGVHRELGRVAALKVLNTARTGSTALERFRNEARIHATVHHPNVATMYEFLELEGAPCIVMEFVDGETLDERLRRRGAIPVPEALAIFTRIVDAVGYLHVRGIVHRDIKANNVKVTSTGVVKVLDFGIAKSGDSPKLTMTGMMVGTPHYASPEQLGQGVVDTPSDIWSLGVLLYEMVTGRLPFEGGGLATITERIMRATYAPPTSLNPRLPRGLDRIIGLCLRVRPEARYRSAEALLTDVRSAAGGDSIDGPGFVQRLGASGEFLALARRRGPVALSITATAIGFAFFIWALFTSPDGVGPSGTDTTLSTAIVPGRPDTVSRGPTTAEIGPTPAPAVIPAGGVTVASREIIVSVIEGEADVYQDNRVVGQTPFTLRASLGERVSLVLRRNGYEDETVSFVVTDGMSTRFTHYMRPRQQQQNPPGDDNQPPESPLTALAFFGALFGRRRRSAAMVRETTELATPARAGEAVPELRLDVGMLSDLGCVRAMNEDTIRVHQPSSADELSRRGVLALVADGMGGHNAGEIASRLAVEAVVQRYGDDERDPGQSLARAVQHANRVIVDAGGSDQRFRGMGTTCTALVLRHGLAYCAHVGDSRLYLVRDGEIFLMTEDHSAVNHLVKSGALSPLEARHHPDKNVIVRALGGRPKVEVSAWPKPLGVRPGDRFVLCSDGLYDLVEDSEIRGMALSYLPQIACERLVAMARDRGGPDNISVGILSMNDAAATGARPVRATRTMEVPS